MKSLSGSHPHSIWQSTWLIRSKRNYSCATAPDSHRISSARQDAFNCSAMIPYNKHSSTYFTMPPLDQNTIKTFQKKILDFYRLHGRKLPFRSTRNPYYIAVAEIMLQQTQVDRVIPKYGAWIKRWPSWLRLAKATPKELLSEWSGLGYNRRALSLGAMARQITATFGGILPTREETLLRLPGIGPYTARAILIFAYNKNRVTIDTNIRRVLIHELKLPPKISLKALHDVALLVLPKNKSRDWHNALMDYASLRLLKTPHIKPLSRQSKFQGSIRQIRGYIIKELTTKKSISQIEVAKKLHRTLKDVERATQGLKKDRLINKRGNRLFLIAS